MNGRGGQSGRSALSKAKVEKLRARFQEGLRELRARPTAVPPDPPPRYDEIFFRGTEWLDQLAAGLDLDEEAEPGRAHWLDQGGPRPVTGLRKPRSVPKCRHFLATADILD